MPLFKTKTNFFILRPLRHRFTFKFKFFSLVTKVSFCVENIFVRHLKDVLIGLERSSTIVLKNKAKKKKNVVKWHRRIVLYKLVERERSIDWIPLAFFPAQAARVVLYTFKNKKRKQTSIYYLIIECIKKSDRIYYPRNNFFFFPFSLLCISKLSSSHFSSCRPSIFTIVYFFCLFQCVPAQFQISPFLKKKKSSFTPPNNVFF